MSKNKEDPPHELENQFILRLPPEYASTVRRAIQSGNVNLKDKLTIELHPDGRHGIVRVDRVPLASKLVDLPCVIGSLKTIDKKTFYKTADICQMLVSTVDGDLYPPLEEPAATNDPKLNKKKDRDREKKFIWNHGITLPLKNVRKRRFRKTAKKKYIESPDVEKEVKRLLSTDAEAVSTRWEVIAEDETKDTDNHGSLTSLDISPGMSSQKQGHSSSVLGLRKQIDMMKGKHQETQDRAKRQEDLIFKVENLALKSRLQAVLDELKQQEEQEKEQLSSLQEQLDSLLEK
uniref:TATA-box binding protein associated factor 7 like n=1 Tax=Monodelphis domestica TaxID=13616 RepID=A0A5F8HE96_MONDO